jgi:hypothetical protein
MVHPSDFALEDMDCTIFATNLGRIVMTRADADIHESGTVWQGVI